MGTLTPHLVTRDPAAAAAWYGSVLGAVETSRMGVVSPVTLGGTCGTQA